VSSTSPLRGVAQRWFSLDGQGAVWEQLYRAVRAEVLEGRLAPGARLPSTRALATELAVSRTTTQCAYDQLHAEGYLVSRRGAGTFVAEPSDAAEPSDPDERVDERLEQTSMPPPSLSVHGARLASGAFAYPYGALADVPPTRFEFLYGLPEPGSFPAPIWRRLISRELREAGVSDLAYGAPEGLLALRRAITDHLTRARGVRCSPEQVLVVAGVQQALHLATRVLVDEGDPVLLEEPHYVGARVAVAAAGARIELAPVDEDGADVSAAPPCRLAYTTPSHQFPTGVVLTLRRRLALLDWAAACGAWIFEDDYDGDYRYVGKPIESLQGLDREGRVLYAGTFSKSLFPALRIGYLVVPEALIAPFRAAKWITDWACPSLEQAALAGFLGEGHYARHLRRSRARYAARRAALLAALAEEFGEDVVVAGANAGLHLLAWFPRLPLEAAPAFIAAARQNDVGVYPVDPYYLGKPPCTGLLLGWGLVGDSEIAEGVRRLREVYSP